MRRANNLIDSLLDLCEKMMLQSDLAPEILKQFYTDLEKGFVDKQPYPLIRPHVATTAQCLRSIFECPCLFEVSKKLSSDKIWEFFESNKWESAGIGEHNIYVAPQVLIITSRIGKRRKDSDKIDEAIKAVISDLKSFLDGRESEHIDVGHGFILYWSINALKKYWNDLTKEEQDVINYTIKYVENLFYRQLALHHLAEGEFDSVQLAYYLSTLVEFSGFKSSTAIRTAIDIIFSELKRGTWQTRPFLHSPDGPTMSCMSIEVSAAIARVLNHRKEFLDLIEAHAKKFEEIVERIELDRKKEGDYIGWRSDRHPGEGGPESWASALVFECLDALVKAIKSYIQKSIVKEFGGKVVSPKVHWSEVVDYREFKRSIEENVIVPIKKGNNRLHKGYGILLYGFPGNGKDSVVYALAEELGLWETITLAPENFLIGTSSVIATGHTIFKKLPLLERVVLFLNEIDAIIAPREVPRQFITPSTLTACMLNWLEKLKNARIIFVIATNRIENFEEALRRFGRLDLVLPIGPPEGDEKKKLIEHLLSEQISKNFLNKNDLEVAEERMDKKMTISEIASLCERIQNALAGGRKLSREELLRIVDHMNRSALTIDEQQTLDDFEANIKKYARY